MEPSGTDEQDELKVLLLTLMELALAMVYFGEVTLHPLESVIIEAYVPSHNELKGLTVWPAAVQE